MEASDLTDEGFGFLCKKFHGLLNLDCSQTQVTDEGLEKIKGLKNLEVLRIDKTRITNRGLGFIANMKNIRKLTLSFNRSITDKGLKELGKLEKLEHLLTAAQPT